MYILVFGGVYADVVELRGAGNSGLVPGGDTVLLV